MFAEHFHMSGQPFLEFLPVERIQRDSRFEQALGRLQYFATQEHLALITGPTGAGKSTLIKLFLSSLARNRYVGLYVHLTQVRSTSILKLVSEQLGLPRTLAKEKVFAQILSKTRSSDFTYILTVDEGHLLTAEALTDLRLLVSSAIDSKPPIKILLAGQQGLCDKIALPELADLHHRISVRYNIKALDQKQTINYINTHLTKVGASQSVFSESVKFLLHEYSNGIPRQINQLATACLLNAYTRKLQQVDDQLFHETLNEFPLQ